MNRHLRNTLLTFIIFMYLSTPSKRNIDAAVATSCLENKKILAGYQQQSLLTDIQLPVREIIDSNLEVCSPPGANVSTCCSSKTENDLKIAASGELKKAILSRTQAFSAFLQENKDFIFDHYRSASGVLMQRLERRLADESSLGPSQMPASRLGLSLANFNTSLHIFLHQPVNDRHAELLLTDHMRMSLDNIYENLFIYSLLKPLHLARTDLPVHHHISAEPQHFNCTRSLRITSQSPNILDLTKKLNSLVIRTLSLTRTLMQSVSISVEVFSGIENLALEDQCEKALARLSFCRVCRRFVNSDDGQPHVRMIRQHENDQPSDEYTYPCNGFCRNVIGGCLAHVIDVEYNWNMFVQSVKRLHAHMRANPDLEFLANNLPNKLVEIERHIAENAEAYKQTIKEQCAVDDSVFNQSPTASTTGHHSSVAIDDVDVESLQIEDRLRKMAEGRWTFKTFPTSLCPPPNLTTCWNGTSIGQYQRMVPNLHIGNQIFRNPEMHIAQQPVIDALKDKLEYINKKLQSKLLSGELGCGNHGDEEDDDVSGGGGLEDYDEEGSERVEYEELGSTSDLDGDHGDELETSQASQTPQPPSNEDFLFSTESSFKTVTTSMPVYIKKDEPRLNVPPTSASNPTTIRAIFIFITSTFIFIINFS